MRDNQEAAIAPTINQQNLSIPPELKSAVQATLEDWDANRKVERFWGGDPCLWTNQGEEKWLGWLNIVDDQQKTERRFANFAAEVKDAGFTHVLLLGMGGSSLCPDVLRKSFGRIDGFPELHVLDSTDPAQIRGPENVDDSAKRFFFCSR